LSTVILTLQFVNDPNANTEAQASLTFRSES